MDCLTDGIILWAKIFKYKNKRRNIYNGLFDMHSHNIVKKIGNGHSQYLGLIGSTQVFPLCGFVNGQMKSHQRGPLVLHKIPQDLFCKNHACSDMSSRNLVCRLYTLQHMCLLLFVCSHWHWDNVIQSLASVDIYHWLSIKSEKSHCLNDYVMNTLLTQILRFIKLIMKMSYSITK